jgi:hypothetical protein
VRVETVFIDWWLSVHVKNPFTKSESPLFFPKKNREQCGAESTNRSKSVYTWSKDAKPVVK